VLDVLILVTTSRGQSRLASLELWRKFAHNANLKTIMGVAYL
jgi:hypothetical protein